jgi:hypothetical protein
MQGREGNTLELIGIGSNVLNGTTIAQQLRDRIKQHYGKHYGASSKN